MRFVLVLSLIFLVSSCSDGITETIRYKTSKATPTLVIPPDLTELNESNNKTLPSSDLGTKKAEGRYKDTGPYIERVLPKFEGIELEGEAGFYWLKVQQKPTDVYAAVKQFWQEEGFTLEKDEPLLGVMQTDWLENKAGSLEVSDNFFTRMLGSLSSSDEKDQYTTRIERDGDSSSKIFLTQKGIEFILVDDEIVGRKQGWQNRPNDPEIEVEMLSRMMLYLGMQDDAVKAQLAKLGQFPSRARLTKDEDDLTKLIVSDGFERAWNRTLVSLDRLGVEIIKQDKAGGFLKIKQKPVIIEKKDEGFFSSLFSSNEKEKKQELIEMGIGLEETIAESTQISIITEEGADDQSETAQALLQYLYKSLK